MIHEVPLTAFDPSLSNLGIAEGIFTPHNNKLVVTKIDLVCPEKDDSKTIRKNSDDLDRAQQLYDAMIKTASKRYVMAEIPQGSQSARSCISAGICIGALAAIRAQTTQLIQITPSEAKLAATGRKTGTKEEIIDWAYNLYPHLKWIKSPLGKHVGNLTNANEHMADAIAIMHAGIKTSQFLDAMKILSILR